MMDNFSSDQDELYYTAKNFNKLKFSNSAYIENTTKDKQDNIREIEILKKEYDKVKIEVMNLKKKNLYATGRLKSASNNPDLENAEVSLLRQKLDYARAQKHKSKEEWKKLEEKLKDLKDEAKLITDDNNPYIRRIKLLENKLDKAMIKFNEAMSIRRTYEQILSRLKEERAGYDNQIAAIQKSLKSKEHDCEEFKLLLQDAKQAKSYSELLLKNTQLSKEAFEQHFEQLIRAHRMEAKHEGEHESPKEGKKKAGKFEIKRTMSSESLNLRTNHNMELEKRVKDYEEADKKIRETTGAEDINEICQKFSNLRETKDKLKKERKELEKMCETLSRKKDDLSNELKKLKYQGQDEITRKEIEDNEKTAERTLKACEEARQKLKKSEKLIVDIRAGVNMITGMLKNKVIEEALLDESMDEKDTNYKKSYQDLLSANSEKDLRISLLRLNDVFEFISEKYNGCKDDENLNNEYEMRLTRKEEEEIEQFYVYNPNNDSNQNSEYGPDDDGDIELNNKEMMFNKNEVNSLANRPFSTDHKKTNSTKYALKARDKK